MNDIPSPTRPTGQRRLRHVLTGAVALSVFLYGIFLVRHISPHAGGSDPSGYLNSARLMMEGHLLAQPRGLAGYPPAEFGQFSLVPLGFILRADGLLAPTYPTGYPLQLIAAALFGWKRAAITLNLFTVLATGLVLYFYGRMLHLSFGSALGGVALLWLCPLFLFSTFLPMSDLSALFWALTACYFAVQARDDWRSGLWCGLALGISVLVRPTNVLLILPVTVAMGIRWRSWLALGLGGFPGAVFFCAYSWRLYGSPWATGYGDVSSAFRVENFLPNFVHFSHWIPILLTPLVLLCAAAPFVRAARQRGLVAIWVWAVALVGFYAFYYHSGETWWYLRFILPAFPAFILATMVVVDTLGQRMKRWGVTTFAAIVAVGSVVAGWQVQQIKRLDVLHLEAGERSYPDAADWARQNLPARSVIFCMQVSGAFFYYTDFLLLRWEQVAPEKYGALLDAIAALDRPIYAALFPYETPEALDRIGGRWDKISTIGQVTIWRRRTGTL